MKLLHMLFTLLLLVPCAQLGAGQDDEAATQNPKLVVTAALEETQDDDLETQRAQEIREKRKHQAWAALHGIALSGCLWALYDAGRMLHESAHNLLANDEIPDGNPDDTFDEMRGRGRAKQFSKLGVVFFPIVAAALSYCAFKLGIQFKEHMKHALAKTKVVTPEPDADAADAQNEDDAQ